ncbi:MAG: hypothetical protein SVM86_07955, partial [Candidatus Cloacimonadota bacterium]|nr:hypothetical protein [Candidatus Cloacimonadota bacterium]
MKKKWFGLGCLSSFLLLILGIVILFNSISRLNKKEIKVEPNTILELNLTGEISEYNELSESSFFSKSTGASSLIQKIEQAATDPNIESILLKPSFVMAGYATCNEII